MTNRDTEQPKRRNPREFTFLHFGRERERSEVLSYIKDINAGLEEVPRIFFLRGEKGIGKRHFFELIVQDLMCQSISPQVFIADTQSVDIDESHKKLLDKIDESKESPKRFLARLFKDIETEASLNLPFPFLNIAATISASRLKEIFERSRHSPLRERYDDLAGLWLALDECQSHGLTLLYLDHFDGQLKWRNFLYDYVTIACNAGHSVAVFCGVHRSHRISLGTSPTFLGTIVHRCIDEEVGKEHTFSALSADDVMESFDHSIQHEFPKDFVYDIAQLSIGRPQTIARIIDTLISNDALLQIKNSDWILGKNYREIL